MINLTLPLALFLLLLLFAGAWLQLLFANSNARETPRIRLSNRADIIGWGGCFGIALLLVLATAWLFASWTGVGICIGIGTGLLLIVCGAAVQEKKPWLTRLIWAGGLLCWLSSILLPLEMGIPSPQISFFFEVPDTARQIMQHLLSLLPGFPTFLPAVFLVLWAGGIGGPILLCFLKASRLWRTKASLGFLALSLFGASLVLMAPVSLWNIQPGIGFLLASFFTLLTAEAIILPKALVYKKTTIRLRERLLPVYRSHQMKKRLTFRVAGLHRPLRTGILKDDQAFFPFLWLEFSTLQAQAYIEDLEDPIAFFPGRLSSSSTTWVSFPMLHQAVIYLEQLPTSLERISPEVLEEYVDSQN